MASAYSSHLHPLLLIVSLLVLPRFLAEAHIVSHLPGFHGALPFRLETGYVTIDELTGAQLFYYFIESERSPKEDPLILWLTGGPCCSGLTPLITEIGPIRFKSVPYNASEGALPQFISHPYSWTKISNIIFLDWPVGSGFSFSEDAQDYNPDDFLSSEVIFKFLMKWYTNHHDFFSNPLYIAGDSYGGKLAPIVSLMIAEGNDAGEKPFLNLQGYLVGNPVTDEDEEYSTSLAYLLGVGVVPSELFVEIRTNCVGEDYLTTNKSLCASKLRIFVRICKEMSLDNILAPLCSLDFDPWAKKLRNPMRKASIADASSKLIRNPPPICDVSCSNYPFYLMYYWANNQISRKALNIKEGTVQEWIRCNTTMNYIDNIKNNVEYHLRVTKRGYRALVYSGDHDSIVPFLSTVRWIKSLNFSVSEKWRPWRVDGQVAGYTEMYANNLTFATVKGGSHTAPNNYPKECFSMFERWISGKPL
ncbi:Serine carboxypeptidase-like 18 [Platanthera zijinensis]|uniref:Serine carboxypeptidase-like 18 n=1 Tax=Platanthera zijinensis TaxID=2320716 RepID=A0AAP0G4M8_9ASPA